MKKLIGLGLLLLGLSFVYNSDIMAQNGKMKGKANCKHQCTKFVDADGDGKCDNFVDANGDGKCDNCTGGGNCDGTRAGMGKCMGSCGNYQDANGDGKCDNFVGKGKCDGTGRNFGKMNPNHPGCKNSTTGDQPANLTLNPNSPNPAGSLTKISFNLKNSANVKVTLFDYSGNKVKDIFNGELKSGDNSVELNTNDLAPGNYLYSVESDGKTQSKPLVIVK